MVITATQSERANGRLSAQKLGVITHQIQTQGYSVVAGLVPPHTCELLLASILEDAGQVQALGEVTPHEKHTGLGHLQLGLRRSAPYVYADLVANLLIEQVVAAVLGSGAWLGFYNGNVNLPGSVFQPLHFDRPFSWPSKDAAAQDGETWPPPTTTLSCSVALSELNQENGATQIYPGTHHETAVAGWAPGERLQNHPELIQRWGPPTRMLVPSGGVCFRDPRMWHRGTPNPSPQVRPMIALTYHGARCLHWRGRFARKLSDTDQARCAADVSLRVLDDGGLGDGRLVFEDSALSAFNGTDSVYAVNRNARFVQAPLKVNHFLDAHLPGGARVVGQEKIEPQTHKFS